ncbi:MAG TPA: hypothetical protein DCM05_02070 [Elusimicrobia bacterium]|nr:hypothetical protein [Elusimicrobiota bacterium]
MKTLSIALLSALLGAALLFHLMGRSSAPKGKDIDSVLKAWEAEKSPGKKKVTFVLGDARQGRDPLSAPKEPTGLERMGAKARRLLGMGSAARPGGLSKALLAEPDTVFTSYDGLFDKGEEKFIRSLANDILKAHQAGAEIDIVAQGEAAPAVLKAIKMLEGGEDKPGVPIRSLVTTGMDEKRLRRQDPEFFSEVARPPNLREWTNLWAERSAGGAGLAVTWYSGEGSGGGFLAGGSMLSQGTQEALLGGGADSGGFDKAVIELGKALKNFRVGGAWKGGQIQTVSGIEPTLDKPEKTAASGLAPPKRAFRDVYGRMAGERGMGNAPPGGGRTGGYGYEAAPAPDMAALRPRPEAKTPAAPSQSVRSEPIRNERDATAKTAYSGDILVEDVIDCGKRMSAANRRYEECWEGSAGSVRVLGRLYKENKFDRYSLCAAEKEGERPQCLEVETACDLPDGNYGIVYDRFGLFRWHNIHTDDCGDFYPFR